MGRDKMVYMAVKSEPKEEEDDDEDSDDDEDNEIGRFLLSSCFNSVYTYVIYTFRRCQQVYIDNFIFSRIQFRVCLHKTPSGHGVTCRS